MKTVLTSNKKQSIQYKISKMMLIVSIMAVLLSAMVAFWGMQKMKKDAEKSSQSLGQLAAVDSEAALIAQAEESLQIQVQERATLTEEKLKNIEIQVKLLAGYVSNIYSYPLKYPPVIVEKPKIENAGKFALQYGLVKGVSYEAVTEEISSVGNLLQVTELLCEDNQTISSVYFASVNGFMISYDKDSDNMFSDKKANEPAELLAREYDPRKQRWYREAVEARTSIFTKAYLDAFDRLLISCAAPVYDERQELKGILAMDILIEDINREIVGAQVGEGGYAFLLDKEGEIVTAPNLQVKMGKYAANNLQNDKEHEVLAQKMVAGESGILSMQIGESEVFAAYAPVIQTNWSMAMILPKEEVVAPALKSHKSILCSTKAAISESERTIQAMFLIFAIAMAIIVVCVILGAKFFSRRLTAPIIKLMEEVHIISQGKLEHVVAVHTGDELEDLGNAFNTMTASLREYMVNLATVQADRERIKTELHIATTIQASMLPCIFPAFPERKEFDIIADMNPAKEVGGDFYDFFFTDHDHLWLVMADVSGKGVPAALFMVIAKTLLKNHGSFESSPACVLSLVNEQLCANNEADMFVTVFMGVLEISTGRFTFSNAGHNFPLLYRFGEQFEWLKSEPTFVLAGLEGIEYTNDTILIKEGDRLFLYTDGVTEALNLTEELYSDKRLLDTLNGASVSNMPLVDMLHYIKEDIATFSYGAEQADDITMMALLFKGESS